MAHGNFPFNFRGDFYPSRSGFEDPNQRPMQPHYHLYSLTPSQVQYGPNRVDFWGSSQSSSMSGCASATPSQKSSQQTSSWESPTNLDEAGQKVYDKWSGEQETFLIILISGQSTITSWRVPKVENIGWRYNASTRDSSCHEKNQDDQESSKPENCEGEKDDSNDEDIKAKGKATKHTRRERKLTKKGLNHPLEQNLEDEEKKERAKTFD